jgi:hypothetical protein
MVCQLGYLYIVLLLLENDIVFWTRAYGFVSRVLVCWGLRSKAVLGIGGG